MPITTQNRYSTSGRLSAVLVDYTIRAFQITVVSSIGLFGYLLWALFSGRLGAAGSMSSADLQNVLNVVSTTCFWLNVSLVVMLLAGIAIYYDSDVFAYALTGVGAFLAFGLNYALDYVSGPGSAVRSGQAANVALGEMHSMALMTGVPGVLLVMYQAVQRYREKAGGQDLTSMTYGAGVTPEKRSHLVIGAFAKCWQLPFCRESIRKRCPIFHAGTKCWKERVGCMCEENIILLAMGDAKQTPELVADPHAGFVPIGDLIPKSMEDTRARIPTRAGRKGVRIPTNPHLTDAQKKERCRNCVIYNEHERQKYQFLSVPATLLVPLLVYWQFGNLQFWVEQFMTMLDRVVGHLSLDQTHASSGIAAVVNGSIPVETFIIVCITLVGMTWVLRLLEYCTFRLKI